MDRWIARLVLVGLVPLLPACEAFNLLRDSSQSPRQLAHLSTARLSEDNFVVIAQNVEGSDDGWGISLILPLFAVDRASPNAALRDLSSKVDMLGRPVALANVNQTLRFSNFLLWWTATEYVRAEVVEFTGPAGVPRPEPPREERGP